MGNRPFLLLLLTLLMASLTLLTMIRLHSLPRRIAICSDDREGNRIDLPLPFLPLKDLQKIVHIVHIVRTDRKTIGMRRFLLARVDDLWTMYPQQKKNAPVDLSSCKIW